MKKNKELTEEKLSELSHKDQVRFALFCANQTRDFWYGSKIYENTYKLIELWLEGKATAEQCGDASSACYDECNSFSNSNKTLTNDFVYAGRTLLYAANIVRETWHTIPQMKLVSNNAIMALALAWRDYADTAKAEQDQLNYYNELRYIDENFEKLVLKE
jgi:hypothetical protein